MFGRCDALAITRKIGHGGRAGPGPSKDDREARRPTRPAACLALALALALIAPGAAGAAFLTLDPVAGFTLTGPTPGPPESWTLSPGAASTPTTSADAGGTSTRAVYVFDLRAVAGLEVSSATLGLDAAASSPRPGFTLVILFATGRGLATATPTVADLVGPGGGIAQGARRRGSGSSCPRRVGRRSRGR